MQTRPVILASGSKTRAGLLRHAGLAFQVHAADIDETAIKTAGQASGATVEAVASALAETKARAINRPGALIIGADQILICDGKWFDKPVSIEAARHHLQALRGRVHDLVTAIACIRDGVTLWQHRARPRLTMRSFSDPFLDSYLALEGPKILQSVGAYRLEGPGVQLFDHVEGEHAAILGLPLLPLLQFLREDGILIA